MSKSLRSVESYFAIFASCPHVYNNTSMLYIVRHNGHREEYDDGRNGHETAIYW